MTSWFRRFIPSTTRATPAPRGGGADDDMDEERGLRGALLAPEPTTTLPTPLKRQRSLDRSQSVTLAALAAAEEREDDEEEEEELHLDLNLATCVLEPAALIDEDDDEDEILSVSSDALDASFAGAVVDTRAGTPPAL